MKAAEITNIDALRAALAQTVEKNRVIPGRRDLLHRLLSRFEEKDWETLVAEWRQWTPDDQQVFAERADAADLFPQLVRLLVPMILGTDDMLALAAAGSLARMADRLRILKPHPMDFSLGLPGRLQELAAIGSGRNELLRLKRRLEQAYTWPATP